MFGPISKFSTTTIALSALLISGCSSDDSGGGTVSTVPANAVTINEANAKDVVAQAAEGGAELIDSVPVLAAVVTQTKSAGQIITILKSKLNDFRGITKFETVPMGEEISLPCDSGSITGNITETETTASGTLVLNECVIQGVTLNGTINFNASIVLATQDYSLNMTGNLSATDSLTTTTLSGLVYNETGNDLSFDYSINSYTFAVDYTGGGGFYTQLLAPIVGNDMQTCPISPSSGILQITGAENTKAKGTINSDGTVTIEYDDGSGTFTEVTEPPPGSPYPCANFFI